MLDPDHPPNALPSAMSGDQPTISKIANVARKSDAGATETSPSYAAARSLSGPVVR